MNSSLFLPPLPLDSLRPDIDRVLEQCPVFLLEAPPGTGKSTRVPLWALELVSGKVLLLEPRRVAARALALHLAQLTQTRPGDLIGLAMRRESWHSASTRLLVVTEGVLTRLLNEDPALEGFSCVLFDEFHERHLTADTGLALTLRSQELLRPDLRIGILSATLDSPALRTLLPDAPCLHSERPGFPVTTYYAPAQSSGNVAETLRTLPGHMANVIADLIARERGGLLAFLPGQGEIARVCRELAWRLPAGCDILPLYGGLPAHEQQLALAPAREGRRKVVLATDIAETSLTIEGVRLVVDSGLQRRPHHDPRRGAQRLVTQTIPLSSAAQRCGRAGRTEPGVCVRLWAQEQEQAMAAHARAEILDADLTPLALELAVWGESPEDLPFVTQPPAGSFAQAQSVLRALGALSDKGVITQAGRAMAACGLAPRSAAALWTCPDKDLPAAAVLCAMLEDERPCADQDLTRAAKSLLVDRRAARRRDILDTALLMLRRLARQGKSTAVPDIESLAACALAVFEDPIAAGRLLLPGWADRLAFVREGAEGRLCDRACAVALTRQGSGVLVPVPDTSAQFILVLDMSLPDTARSRGQGDAFATATLFCQVEESLVLGRSDIIRERQIRVRAPGIARVYEVTRLENMLLDEQRTQPDDADQQALEQALCAWAVDSELRCLPWDDETRCWLARADYAARTQGKPWPRLNRETLLDRWHDWLPDVLQGHADWRSVTSRELARALRALLPWECQARLDDAAPAFWTSPCGRRHAVLYDEETPCVTVKLQECFGLRETPLLGGREPLTLRLLSPGGTILASTRDLPFFWKYVYPEVRAQMRGRYPRHPWPEDPLAATPTILTNKALRARGQG